MKPRAAVLVLFLAACSRSPLLVEGPIDLTGQPTVHPFVRPVVSTGPQWELCFEFQLPGDSRRASAIHATLISSVGVREALGDPELDRRGESIVCQIGRVTPAAYQYVELRADGTLRLRGIRGGRPG